MDTRDPTQPFEDEQLEAYVQARGKGASPAAAGKETGYAGFRSVERGTAFRARLREVLAAHSVPDARVSLAWIVTELKRNVAGARAVNQFKSSTEALQLLTELLERHGEELRGDATPSQHTADVSGNRQERRAAHRGRLAVVPDGGGGG